MNYQMPSRPLLFLLFLGCLTFIPTEAKAVCCGPVCGFLIGGMCGDCTSTSAYCGVGSCNIFGCNCDGGCRTGRCDQVGSAAVADRRYFETIAGPDDAITYEEFQSWGSTASRFPAGSSPRTLFDAVDRNRNGRIEVAEFDKDLPAARPSGAPPPPAPASTPLPVTVLRVEERDAAAAGVYWTEDRMRKATPMIPKPPERLPPLTARPDGPPLLIPGEGALASPGQIVAADVGQRPFWNGGKLFFSTDDGDRQCTAEFTGNANVLLTAAHCVFDAARKKFYTNFNFRRAYSNGGGQSVSLDYLIVYNNWYTPSNNFAYDYAFAHTTTASGAGWLGLAANLPYSTWTAIGYSSNFSCGNYMSQVAGSFGANYSGIIQMVNNPMAPGASGGAWIGELQSSLGGNFAIGVNSFYYTSEPKNLYGPYFNGGEVYYLYNCALNKQC